jgi:hypothetical protein
MSIEELVLSLFLIIIICGILYVTIIKVHNFDELKKAVILQDLNLENDFNKMESDFNKIKTNTNEIYDKINDKKNNLDCLGKFSVCDKNDEGNCVKKYKVYREKTGDGKECEHSDGHPVNCENGGGNCPSQCIGEWDETKCADDNVKTFKVSNNKNGIKCIGGEAKHGETKSCD